MGKKKLHYQQRLPRGFTVIDVLVGTALLVIVALGISGGFQVLFKVLSQSQNKNIALGLANEQIEIIRNLEYQNIGTIGGVPSGSLLQNKTEEIRGRIYSISTDIIYIDDPCDQTVSTTPSDNFPADYKKARVEVSWQDHNLPKSIVEIANFSPPNLESEVGGGTLSLYVKDSQSYQAIPHAEVRIINSQVEPNVNIITNTDDNGWLSRPGLASSTDYQIIVSQTNYDTHQTYEDSPSLDPEPEYSHAKIIDGHKTTRYFAISKTSDIKVYTIDDQSQPLANILFNAAGGRKIGVDPSSGSNVYSYQDNSLATDLNGEKQINDVSPGEYYFEITDPDYAVLTPNLEKPLILESDSQQIINLTLAPIDEPYLRVLVKNASTTDAVAGAIVHLHNQDYDKSVQSNEDGLAIFPFDATALANGDYTLEVSKNEYQNYSAPQTINNFTKKAVDLIPSG